MRWPTRAPHALVNVFALPANKSKKKRRPTATTMTVDTHFDLTIFATHHHHPHTHTRTNHNSQQQHNTYVLMFAIFLRIILFLFSINKNETNKKKTFCCIFFFVGLLTKTYEYICENQERNTSAVLVNTIWSEAAMPSSGTTNQMPLVANTNSTVLRQPTTR
jgi:NADH:ubiquinone oxidoreductase subunit 3 (subunit A)